MCIRRAKAFLFFLIPFPMASGVFATPNAGYGLLWESRYVSEGRNNLEAGGLVSGEIDFGWDSLVAGIWFAVGDSVSYEELNLYLEYGFGLGPLEAHAGYTRLEFPADNESDDEFHFGIAYGDLPFLTVALNYTYSIEAGGGFLEIMASTEIKLLEDSLIVQPYALQALDFGYASAEHDGLNNFQAGLAVNYPLNRHASLYCAIHHSWAQKDVNNEGNVNISWLVFGRSGHF